MGYPAPTNAEVWPPGLSDWLLLALRSLAHVGKHYSVSNFGLLHDRGDLKRAERQFWCGFSRIGLAYRLPLRLTS